MHLAARARRRQRRPSGWRRRPRSRDESGRLRLWEERGRSRRGSTGGSGRVSSPPASYRAPHRAAAPLQAHRRNRSDRTGRPVRTSGSRTAGRASGIRSADTSSHVQYPPQAGHHIGAELVVRRRRGGRKGADHDQRTGRQVRALCGHPGPQPAVDLVPSHGTAHRLVHHEADARRRVRLFGTQQMKDDSTTAGAPAQSDGAPVVVGPAEPVRRGEHGVVTVVSRSGPSASGREALTTLAATSGEDRAARAGPHPKAEAVLLVPATVVRLERPLAHWNDSGTCLDITRSAAPSLDLPRSGSAIVEKPGPSPSAAQNGRLNTDRSTVRALLRPGQTDVFPAAAPRPGYASSTKLCTAWAQLRARKSRLPGFCAVIIQTLSVASTRHAESCPRS